MSVIEAVKVSGDLAKIIRHIMWFKSLSGSDDHSGESREVDDESQCHTVSHGVNRNKAGHDALVA